MTQQLPERANLEQLKKQAKSLLHAARGKDPAALERFRVIPALAKLSSAESLALHDAQFIIAREYGFKSWNDLREHVEERSLSVRRSSSALHHQLGHNLLGSPRRALAAGAWSRP